MVLVADDRGDDALLVHHADVGAVGEEGLPVGRHRHPWNKSSFSHLFPLLTWKHLLHQREILFRERN